MHALNKNGKATDIHKENLDFLSLVSEEQSIMRKAKAAIQAPALETLSFTELFGLHGHDVHDFLYHFFGNPTLAKEHMQKLYRKAYPRFQKECYQRYAKIWFLRLSYAGICDQVQYWARNRVKKVSFAFSSLAPQEAVALLLRERLGLTKIEICKVMGLTMGAVENRLLHAREKLAQRIQHWPASNPFSFSQRGKYDTLKMRIEINRDLDGEMVEKFDGEEAQLYRRGLESVRSQLQGLPIVVTPEIAYELKERRKKDPQTRFAQGWLALSWHYKLIAECAAFAIVGAIAVFILPAFLAYYDGNEASLKKAQAILPVATKPIAVESAPLTERNLASISAAPHNAQQNSDDDFAYMDFPTGDNHLEGSAPLAPSRKGGAIYRLIVQSENPKELIPKIRSLFVAAKVAERDRSGSTMPGGIYFDGITTDADYNKIFSALSAIAPTRTYNQFHKGKGNERARLIIWVQQI